MTVPVVIITILMAGVLSEPQVTTKTVTNVYGYPVMLVVDISGSMDIDSKQKSGYEQSLRVFRDLISRRGDINYGLLLCSTETYIARYFINKEELFQDTLENTDDVIELSMGTRVDEGLKKARQFLNNKLPLGAKTIILISDINFDSKTLVYTIQEMIKISLSDINLYVVVTGKDSNVVNEIPRLKKLKFLDMENEDSINNMCEEISSMQMNRIRVEENLIKKDLTALLILTIIVIIIISLVFSATALRKVP